MNPRISIVIPTYNQGKFIEQTIASVLGQQWPELELIVVDGGSTDATAEVVGRYRSSIAHFISEKDSGQASAINKGFRLATGDIFAWLNSDDMYLPLTLKRIAALLPGGSIPALVYGGCLMFTEGAADARGVLPKPYDGPDLKCRDYIFQPSSFWTRALWEKTGELNERHHFVLDWDWYIRAGAFCEFQAVPEFWSLYRFHANHKTSSGDSRRSQEIVGLIEQYGAPEWAAAYREVAACYTELDAGLKRLQRLGLYRFRKQIYRGIYGRHDFRVRIALNQLRGTM